MPPIAIQATLDLRELPILREPAIPGYLEQVYWWAYVHPNAVRLFERKWLVNAILFGNYPRLRDAALDELGQSIPGKTSTTSWFAAAPTPSTPGCKGRARRRRW